ncbi:MAG: ATP-dependent sacrificial sulfur transferase LarE [Deltaproteobacteria bacterium]|nr:ATP-dependent sacrificial sulfur transferase LarE [Deltaproteobacteria bacterium]
MFRMEKLKEAIRAKERLLIMFSGGLDSTLLAKIAFDELGDAACALSIKSPIIRSNEISEAGMNAEIIGIPHGVIEVDELADDRTFAKNPIDRCYICRKSRNRAVIKWAGEKGFAIIADGMNYSDLEDYRPGIKAAREDCIWQPFVEFGITKQEIRRISRMLNLPTWDKLPTVGLCSRFPYGYEITRERIQRVEKAEALLEQLGFVNCRVRYFPFETAIIEVDDLQKALSLRDKLVSALAEIGFSFVSLDLEGCISGKMNRIVKKG